MSEFATKLRDNRMLSTTPRDDGAIVRSVLAVTLVLLGWKFWAVVLADVGANLFRYLQEASGIIFRKFDRA